MENGVLFVILSAFMVIAGLISLENHYQFRTYALDLGMFNHALYSFAHFKVNYFTLASDGSAINYFADHFSLITVLYAPFYYLMHSYTLLIIQLAAIAFGGFGIYLVAKERLASKYLPLIVTAQFFGLWGIYSALAFDFHNNVVAAMFVPWLFYFYFKDRRKAFLAFFVLIIIAKENMALWLAFIMIGLMIQDGVRSREKWEKRLKFEIPLTVAAVLYFVVVVAAIMPALGTGGTITQFQRYSLLGDSPSAIATTMVTDPAKVATLLVDSPTGTPQAHVDDKRDLHLMVLGSGGLSLLAAPSYLVMLIPIYLQKMLTTDVTLWGTAAQYSIEFAPILPLAMIAFLVKLRRRKFQYPLAILFAASTFFSLYVATTADSLIPASFNNADNIAVFSDNHYSSEIDGLTLDIPGVQKVLESVPDGVPISVTSSLAPHLASRDEIYEFPIIKDAQYIVLMRDDQDNFVDPRSLPDGKDFQLIGNWPRLKIFKRAGA